MTNNYKTVIKGVGGWVLFQHFTTENTTLTKNTNLTKSIRLRYVTLTGLIWVQCVVAS